MRTLSLSTLDLPAAPPVVRASAALQPRRRLPALVLLVLGTALVLGPIVGGVFSKVASGQQLVDAFAPHLTLDSLDRYDGDLKTLREGATALTTVYGEQAIPKGRYPGLDDYRVEAPGIDARATTLLTRIRGAEPDYRKVADIGGFDRVPFLLVTTGLALAYAGGVLLGVHRGGRRQRAAGAAVLALAAGAALIAYPLLSSLPSGTRAGERLQHALAPLMTTQTVRAEQDDFVVLVTAVGELDTAFRAVQRSGQPGARLTALDQSWPAISSDLATLVGAINDNLHDYRQLVALDDTTSSLGFSGLIALPWFLVGAGGLSVAAALAALARPTTKERS
jgi:hypothetical protein